MSESNGSQELHMSLEEPGSHPLWLPEKKLLNNDAEFKSVNWKEKK